jgi:hypothetical protein
LPSSSVGCAGITGDAGGPSPTSRASQFHQPCRASFARIRSTCSAPLFARQMGARVHRLLTLVHRR